MRPFPLTTLQGGINRLQVKGNASAHRLYDLVNAYITNDGTVSPREGTSRYATLDTNTVGLAANAGLFNIFSNTFTTSTATVPAGFQLNVLVHPTLSTATPTTIWFAKPFMGFLYVVAQFSSGDIFHYWLQSNGVWSTNTVYKTNNIVTPTPANGLAYQAVRDFPPNPTWTPDTSIVMGNIIEPTQYTGFAYKVVSVASDQGIQSTGVQPSLLLHFDGNFNDSSVNKLPITVSGATTEPSVVKFGSGAMSNPYNAEAYISTPVTVGGPIDISVGDFTIEFFVNLAISASPGGGALGLNQTTDVQTNTATPSLSAGNVSGSVQVSCGIFGTVLLAGNVASNTWTHVALTRHGIVFTLWIGGVSVGIPFNSSANLSMVNPLTIGNFLFNVGGNTSVTGFIDEYKLTKGTALYTAGFTPPNAPFLVVSDAHTGSVEPVWPTVSGATLQEFGDFSTSATAAGSTQATTTSVTAALGKNITDRYGNSATVANAGVPAATSLTLPTVASTLITTWKPGTLYAPGAVVQPTTNQGAFINAIPNGDFENGNDGSWTFTGITPWAFSNSGTYQGNWCIAIPTGNVSAGGDFAVMTNFGVVTQGQSVTASAYLNPNNAGANLDLWIQLNWYDSTDTLLSSTVGTHQEGGGYRQSSVTGIAPMNAAHCRVAIGAGSGTNSRNTGYADLVVWNLEQPVAISNFLYEAIQVSAGSSGQAQPTWPTNSGGTVIDGGVTWKAIGTSIITWEAIPLMLSGSVQPTFPTTVGLSVNDPSTFTDINGNVINTHMSWQCISRQITDPKCPNTNSVALGASHVFAGDKDIVDFSAAVDPTNWSSTNNAGYLPTGLNNYGDNPVAMLALYRSNLVVFNAGGYQMWQIDPDPANMALLDAQPVGSIWPRAAQSVANDLLFLTEVGVRNLGTIGATANMAIGNTGQPIDPLVKAQINSATYTPLSLYYPGRGQYWLIFGPQAFVLTINGQGNRTWSRYVFPQSITDWTLNAGILYLRTANNLVYKFTDAVIGVDDATGVSGATNTPWNGIIQWPYLNAGALGINKEMVGIDIVGDGNVSIQVAFNQSDKTTFNDNAGFSVSTGITAPYFVAISDTVPGEPIPIPCNAPSYSIVLTFAGSSTSANAWTWEALNLYLNDQNGGGATG